jgi:hypothetical protein
MLNDPQEVDFDEVEEVGFIFRRPGGNQYHVGFLFKSEDKVMVRHQCDHLDTRQEQAGRTSDLWTNIAAVSLTNKALIAAKLAKIGGDKVPYGVGYNPELRLSG